MTLSKQDNSIYVVLIDLHFMITEKKKLRK